MYVTIHNSANTQPLPLRMIVKKTTRFVTQLYFVLTDHCVECGTRMDERTSYGMRCMHCEGQS